MKDNILVTVLILLVILLGGVSLLLGFNGSISGAIAPLSRQITELTSIDRELLQKQNMRPNTDNENPQFMFLNQRIAMLESKIGMLEARLGNSEGAQRQFGPQQFGPQQFGPQQFGQQAPQQRPPQPQEDPNKVYPLNIGTSPILGNPNAPVTIVEFSDFQCPFCERFHPVLRDVLKAYPDKVKIVIKNFPLPFHPNARPAAKLALAANLQGKYFDMIDLLMQNGASVEDSKVKDYARTLHINYRRLMDDVKNRDAEWERIIGEDMTLANQSSVQGTPTYFINGRKTNARDLPSYKTEIDKILSGRN